MSLADTMPDEEARTIEERVRLIAFYLPQFHPIPENDRWWGEGFTEWRNVVSSEPLFRGHEQPLLPGELGYYDLRDPSVPERQADLAREHGISAFCYFHYWFEGKRLLGSPLDALLASGKPDFPFCLCWANEPWTRAWDGASGEVLMEQRYSAEDDRNHLRWLAAAFRDERYVRIDGKPLFLVYRASALPDARTTALTWRDEARALGLGELYLARVESSRGEHADPAEIGFDAAVEFQPDWTSLPPPLRRRLPWRILRRLGVASRGFSENRVLEYAGLVERALAKPDPGYLRYPCVTPRWDNSPRRRRGDAVVFVRSTPERYEAWLGETVRRAAASQGPDPIVFVNAWNEWAEGNVLEPSEPWERAYLEATRRARSGAEEAAKARLFPGVALRGSPRRASRPAHDGWRDLAVAWIAASPTPGRSRPRHSDSAPLSRSSPRGRSGSPWGRSG